MDLSARRQPPTVRLRRLASELRGLRTAAGLTREEVSDQTAINSATLYRIETAKVRPQRRTLMTLLDKYGVTDEAQRSELIALSRQATQLGWLHAFGSELLSEQYLTYISFEAEAHSVRNYESMFVPGLLQTADYARAIIKGVLPVASKEEAERRVKVRMQRQDCLRKKSPLKFWAILDEAVLHRRVGGVAVMVEQLRTLAKAASQPHITLQVIPFASDAHPGMLGSFAIMDFPDAADPGLVYVDSMAGDLFLEREPDLQRYTATFEHLQTAALAPSDSVQMIENQADALQRRDDAR